MTCGISKSGPANWTVSGLRFWVKSATEPAETGRVHRGAFSLAMKRIDAVSVVTAPSERPELRMVVDGEHRALNWCSNDTTVADDWDTCLPAVEHYPACACVLWTFLTNILSARRRFETSIMRRWQILRFRTLATRNCSIARTTIRHKCMRNYRGKRGQRFVFCDDGATCQNIYSSIPISELVTGRSWPLDSVFVVCSTSTMRLSISWHMVSSESRV